MRTYQNSKLYYTGMQCLDKEVIKWLSQIIVGYDDKADGFLTSGGSGATVIAMWAARRHFQQRHVDIRK